MLRLRQRVFRIFLLSLVGTSSDYGNAQTKALTEASTRYLYILNCDATLQKFDTLSRKQIFTSNLAKYSRFIPTHGSQANSVVDGCSTFGVAYQAKTAMLYTVAPTTGSMEPGAVRHYRILSFRVSDLKPAIVINLPGKYDADDSPTLTTDRSGQIGVITHNRYSRIAQGRLVPADWPSDLPGSHPPTSDDTFYELDLSTYHSSDAQLTGHTDRLAYQPLERSGNAVLIKVPLSKQAWGWVLADAATRRLMHLNLPFHSTDNSVHLIPGGQVVLEQEASYGPAGASFTKGNLALIDVGTGAVIKTWTDPALDRKYILTITPQGEMVYYGGGSTVFVPLGVHPSSGEPVMKLGAPFAPSFFYADR